MRSRRGIAALGLAIGVPLLVGACIHLQPSVPMRAQHGDLELTLEALRAAGFRDLIFRSRSTGAHAIRSAWLTEPTRDPCSGGAEAGKLGIDLGRGGVPGSNVLSPGEHELRVTFNGQEDFDLDVVVDLEIDDGVCVRAPAISQSLPMVAENRWMLTGGMDILGNADLWGLRATLGFQGGVSRWFGPLMLNAMVGVGTAICNEATCGREDKDNLRSGLAVPLSIDARYGWVLGRQNRMLSVGFVGARYTLTPVTLPAFDGDRRFVVHGAQGVLGWGLSDLVKGPFLHPERTVAWDFSVPIGLVVYPDAPGNRVAFAIGLQLRMMIQL